MNSSLTSAARAIASSSEDGIRRNAAAMPSELLRQPLERRVGGRARGPHRLTFRYGATAQAVKPHPRGS